MADQRTYWHLASARRLPSTYEIATSRLLYYGERGFSLKLPLSGWYERYQRASPLVCDDWEAFADPRQTTYANYTALQLSKESFAEGIVRSISERAYDRELSAAWLGVLERLLAPLRYPCHGLQMVAAYVGQMAPASRIVVAALLQTADEMRRIQWLAYRLRQLQLVYPDFGTSSLKTWEYDACWQPLRQVIERLLVTYDWGEAFVALNLAVKPAFDEFFMSYLAECGRQRGDYLLGELLGSLAEDCHWHRDWSRALVAVAVASQPANAAVVERWQTKWLSETQAALVALKGVAEGSGDLEQSAETQ